MTGNFRDVCWDGVSETSLKWVWNLEQRVLVKKNKKTKAHHVDEVARVLCAIKIDPVMTYARSEIKDVSSIPPTNEGRRRRSGKVNTGIVHLQPHVHKHKQAVVCRLSKARCENNRAAQTQLPNESKLTFSHPSRGGGRLHVPGALNLIRIFGRCHSNLFSFPFIFLYRDRRGVSGSFVDIQVNICTQHTRFMACLKLFVLELCSFTYWSVLNQQVCFVA